MDFTRGEGPNPGRGFSRPWFLLRSFIPKRGIGAFLHPYDSISQTDPLVCGKGGIHMKQRRLLLAAALVLALLLSACSAQQAGQSGPFATLTDVLGRQVTIEKQPEKIVSSPPTNTEIVCALGSGTSLWLRTPTPTIRRTYRTAQDRRLFADQRRGRRRHGAGSGAGGRPAAAGSHRRPGAAGPVRRRHRGQDHGRA